MQCKEGSFGPQCKGTCQCLNNATCDKTDGTCDCLPGWIGVRCDNPCPAGYYGKYCQSKCKCQNGGSCDPVDGNCTCVSEWQGQTCDLCKLALNSCTLCKCQNPILPSEQLPYIRVTAAFLKGKFIPRQREVYKSVSRAARGSRVDVSGLQSRKRQIGPLFLRPFGDQEMLLAMKFGGGKILKQFGS